MPELSDTERLLRYALAPVDPPHALSDRLERRLALVAGAAAEELADWELSAMRDPRNWVRPVAAVAVGGAAAGALVVLRARQHARAQQSSGLSALDRGAREAMRSGVAPIDRGAREVVRGLRRRIAR